MMRTKPLFLPHHSKSARPRLLTKYSPSQPRVPSGSAEGGRWTGGGGGKFTSFTVDDSGEVIGRLKSAAKAVTMLGLRGAGWIYPDGDVGQLPKGTSHLEESARVASEMGFEVGTRLDDYDPILDSIRDDVGVIRINVGLGVVEVPRQITEAQKDTLSPYYGRTVGGGSWFNMSVGGDEMLIIVDYDDIPRGFKYSPSQPRVPAGSAEGGRWHGTTAAWARRILKDGLKVSSADDDNVVSNAIFATNYYQDAQFFGRRRSKNYAVLTIDTEMVGQGRTPRGSSGNEFYYTKNIPPRAILKIEFFRASDTGGEVYDELIRTVLPGEKSAGNVVYVASADPGDGEYRHVGPSTADGSKYSPSQPRVPSGSSEGGRWSDGGGGMGSSRVLGGGEVISDANVDAVWDEGRGRAIGVAKTLDFIQPEQLYQGDIPDDDLGHIAIAKGAKAMVVRDLAADTGLPEGVVNQLVRQWAETSNDNDYRALWLQKMAAKEFGVELSDWQRENIEELESARVTTLENYGGDVDLIQVSLWTPFEEARATSSITQSRELIIGPYKTDEEAGRAFLRAMYDRTQSFLAEHGVEEVVLYRGVGSTKGGEVGDHNPGATNAMESWSTSLDTAMDFPGNVERAVFPRARIISTPFTGQGCLNEREFIVLGGPGRAEVVFVPGQEMEGVVSWEEAEKLIEGEG